MSAVENPARPSVSLSRKYLGSASMRALTTARTA
jgi:hypothetical protein